MKKKETPHRLYSIIIFLAVVFYAGFAFAAVNHSIHIEWDYDPYGGTTEAELESYRLYKNGVQICQFDTPYDYEGDCEFTSENGLFNFNLTAVFDDGSESPLSAPFPFQLGPTKANPGVILATLSLLLNKDNPVRPSPTTYYSN